MSRRKATANIPILMYHHVVPADRVLALAPFAVSHDLFSEQLDWLTRAGFRTISLGELFDVQGGPEWRVEGRKPVVITFDDCPAGLLDHAIPELTRRGMTATFFAVAAKLGGNNDWDAEQGAPEIPLMTSVDLQKLADNGFEIGSHGLTHSNLRKCLPEQIRRELIDSRQIREETVGGPIRFFAYPFGEYPEGFSGYCQDAGYRGAVSIFSRARTVIEDPYCMRRILVHEGDQAFLFRVKTSTLYLKVRQTIDKKVIEREAKSRVTQTIQL